MEQQIREKGTLIPAAQAIAGLSAKKPYNRNAIIQWSQLTKHTAAYGSFDQLAHQTMARLIAEQGFVPAESFRAAKENAEKTISVYKAETKRWEIIAKKRLEELKACQKQLGKKHEVEDRKLNESIARKIVDIVDKRALGFTINN